MTTRTLTSHPSARTVILCPLQFERNALVRALRRLDPGIACTAAVIGPGSQNFAARVAALPVQIPDGPASCVLLAGLAGALDDSIPLGEAAWIARVCDEDGAVQARPSLLPNGARQQDTAIVSMDEVVGDAAERSDLAIRSGANLVDMESDAFATLANERGWAWGLVRGVSDTSTTGLPNCAMRWADARGQSRPLAVLTDLLKREVSLREMLRMQRDGQTAMRAVARLIFRTGVLDAAAPRNV